MVQVHQSIFESKKCSFKYQIKKVLKYLYGCYHEVSWVDINILNLHACYKI